MCEDIETKRLKRKMDICTILQRKFGCKCNQEMKGVFCTAVEELHKV